MFTAISLTMISLMISLMRENLAETSALIVALKIQSLLVGCSQFSTCVVSLCCRLCCFVSCFRPVLFKLAFVSIKIILLNRVYILSSEISYNKSFINLSLLQVFFDEALSLNFPFKPLNNHFMWDQDFTTSLLSWVTFDTTKPFYWN